MISDCIVLSEQQRVELGRIASSRSLPAGYLFRARLILLHADGASCSLIKQRLRTTAPTISRWKQRFVAHGLDTAHPGQKLSAHKTRLVHQFRQNNPRVQFHFTPTYSSWLNQVELWFGKIERDLIARGVFTSLPDLARKIKRYIRAYSANAKPIQWKYSDPKRRIRSNECTATGHLRLGNSALISTGGSQLSEMPTARWIAEHWPVSQLISWFGE